MSSQLENAFNLLLGIKPRAMTFTRLGIIASVPLNVSPSNYSRQLAGPEDITIEGQEFVVSKAALAQAGIDRPKRGDRLEDPETGLAEITEVRPMYGLGNILGYRIRTA